MSFLNSAKQASNGTLSSGSTAYSNWMYAYSYDYYANNSYSYSYTSTDYDYFTVSLKAGKTYTVDTSDAYSWGYGLDTKLYLVDSTGKTVANSSNISDWNLNDSLTFKATSSGTYYVVVENTESSSYKYGYYNITLQEKTNEAPVLTGVKSSLSQLDLNKSNTYTISATDLLSGFTDSDGDTLSVGSLSTDSGTIVNNGNQTWTFTPGSTSITSSQTVNITYSISDAIDSTSASSSFSIIPKDAKAELKFEQISTTTNEGGNSANLKVYLTKNPGTTANPNGGVNFTFKSSDATEGVIEGSKNGSYSFSLNKDNWSTGVTLKLIGQQDYINDGSVSYKIDLTSLSTDTATFNDVIRQNTEKSWSFVNAPDLNEDGKDRDAPVYIVGDANGPTKDYLTGIDGADRLYGGYMVDELDGGLGDDRLYGSYEDDYLYAGAGNDQLFGEQDDDYLFGGIGNDRLDGGIGSDRLEGGLGDDVYYLSLNDDGSVEDEVIEAAGAGSDTVYIPYEVEEYTAPDNIEIIKMNAGFSNSIITGNSSNNTMTGNGGDNELDGAVGNDTLSGGLGDDLVSGGVGNDILSGGKGEDQLEGGAGSDTFKFASISDSKSLSTADVILDLSGGDRIDLSAIDANTQLAGNQAFKFAGAGSTNLTASTFSSSQIGYVKFLNDYLYINNDIDSAADMTIKIVGADIDSTSFSTYIIA